MPDPVSRIGEILVGLVLDPFFTSRVEVAAKLATRNDWANYRAATDRYRAGRQAGQDVQTAVNAWIDKIADEGYNHDPKAYKAILKNVARKEDLYKFSAAVMRGGGTTPVNPDTPPDQNGAPSTEGWVAIHEPAEAVDQAARHGGGGRAVARRVPPVQGDQRLVEQGAQRVGGVVPQPGDLPLHRAEPAQEVAALAGV